MQFLKKCIILGLIILTAACSNGIQSINQDFSSRNIICKPSQEKAKGPLNTGNIPFSSKFENRPLYLDDFTEPASELTPFAHKQENIILESGRELAAIINVECFLSHNKKFNNALFHVGNSSANNSLGGEETIPIYLKSAIDLSELEYLISKEPCLKGVSNSIKLDLLSVPNDPYYSNQRHLASINHDATFDFYFNSNEGISGDDIIIAVIDNGVDIDHLDLKANIWKNATEVNGLPNVDDDKNGYVDDLNGWDFGSGAKVNVDGNLVWQIYENNNPRPKPTIGTVGFTTTSNHGTHVSGLIGAVTNNSLGTAGVMAKNIKIMPLNAWGNSEGPSSAVLSKAIRYAANNGAKIINLSLGGIGKSADVENALSYAISKGSFIVAAAGNNNTLLDDKYFYMPASYSNSLNGMVSVAAVSAANVSNKCSFSNYSSTLVDIAAPGCDSLQPKGLLSTFIHNFTENDLTGYGFMNGTSQATPLISGVAAVSMGMVRSYAGKELSPADTEITILEGAKTYSSLNNQVANGRVSDLSAIKSYIETKFTKQSKCP